MTFILRNFKMVIVQKNFNCESFQKNDRYRKDGFL